MSFQDSVMLAISPALQIQHRIPCVIILVFWGQFFEAYIWRPSFWLSLLISHPTGNDGERHCLTGAPKNCCCLAVFSATKNSLWFMMRSSHCFSEATRCIKKRLRHSYKAFKIPEIFSTKTQTPSIAVRWFINQPHLWPNGCSCIREEPLGPFSEWVTGNDGIDVAYLINYSRLNSTFSTCEPRRCRNIN